MVPGRWILRQILSAPQSSPPTLGPSQVHAPSCRLGIGDPIPLPIDIRAIIGQEQRFWLWLHCCFAVPVWPCHSVRKRNPGFYPEKKIVAHLSKMPHQNLRCDAFGAAIIRAYIYIYISNSSRFPSYLLNQVTTLLSCSCPVFVCTNQYIVCEQLYLYTICIYI